MNPMSETTIISAGSSTDVIDNRVHVTRVYTLKLSWNLYDDYVSSEPYHDGYDWRDDFTDIASYKASCRARYNARKVWESKIDSLIGLDDDDFPACVTYVHLFAEFFSVVVQEPAIIIR